MVSALAQYFQVGLVVGGISKCGDKSIPSYFTRLDHPEIANFINSPIRPNHPEIGNLNNPPLRLDHPGIGNIITSPPRLDRPELPNPITSPSRVDHPKLNNFINSPKSKTKPSKYPSNFKKDIIIHIFQMLI